MKPSKFDIESLYLINGKSSREIATLLHTSKTQVLRWLKSYNIVVRPKSYNRIHKLNEEAFDKIDEESAYWIGFIAADGTLLKTNYNIRLTVAVKDKLHLEKFKRFLKTDYDITYTKPTDQFGGKGCCVISIYSKYIFNKLLEYGLKPRKSLTLSILKLQYDRHFWRGMVDGDGCICTNGKYPSINLTGSLASIKQFKNYVKSICLTKANILPNNSVWSFRVNGKKSKIVAFNLYNACSIYLDRKLIKYKEML